MECLSPTLQDYETLQVLMQAVYQAREGPRVAPCEEPTRARLDRLKAWCERMSRC